MYPAVPRCDYSDSSTALCDCPEGQAGPSCQLQCPNCTAMDIHSYCPDGRNIQSVNCICNPGYIYNLMTQRCDCPDNQYGSECQFTCPLCLDVHSRCDDGLNGTGKCICFSSFVPMNDTCICPPQMYGPECNQTCPLCATTIDTDCTFKDGIQGDGSCQCPSDHFITTSTGCTCQPGKYVMILYTFNLVHILHSKDVNVDQAGQEQIVLLLVQCVLYSTVHVMKD